MPSGNYTISVGAGGVGGAYNAADPTNGGNSYAFNWFAVGGGAGGSSYTQRHSHLFEFYRVLQRKRICRRFVACLQACLCTIADMIKRVVEGGKERRQGTLLKVEWQQ